MIGKIRFIGAMLTLIAAFMSLAGNASAITAQGIGLEPVVDKADATAKEKAFFIYQLTPGVRQTGSFRVTNHSSTTKTIDLFPADATTTADGTFAMLNELKEVKDIGSWVTVTTPKVTLAPGATKTVGIAIDTPVQASVGDHLGGIIAQDAEATNKVMSDDSTGIKVVSRIGLRIYGTVAGKAEPTVSVTSFQAKRNGGKLQAVATLKNNGNTIVNPVGTVVFKPMIGKHMNVAMPRGITLAPGATYTFTSDVSTKPLLLERYCVTANIQYGTKSALAVTGLTAHNIRNLLITMLILCLILFTINRYKRFKKLYVRRDN